MYRTLATLVALIAFVQAIESVSADDGLDKFVELYNSVFADNSQPLEPEEARKAIQRIDEGLDKYYKYAKFESFLVTGLVNAETRVRQCYFENYPELTNWDSSDIRYFTLEMPALQPYMQSLRARMVKCFRRHMDAAVEYYSSMIEADKTGAYAHLKESLADMPLELFTRQNFIETKNDKISKVLVGVVEKKYDGECADEQPKKTTCLQRMTKSSKPLSFTKMFQDSVVEFCGQVVEIQLVPRSIQPIAYRDDTISMLGQEVVEWAKVQHLCKRIKRQPDAAAQIVHEAYLEGKGARAN